MATAIALPFALDLTNYTGVVEKGKDAISCPVIFGGDKFRARVSFVIYSIPAATKEQWEDGSNTLEVDLRCHGGDDVFEPMTGQWEILPQAIESLGQLKSRGKIPAYEPAHPIQRIMSAPGADSMWCMRGHIDFKECIKAGDDAGDRTATYVPLFLRLVARRGAVAPRAGVQPPLFATAFSEGFIMRGRPGKQRLTPTREYVSAYYSDSEAKRVLGRVGMESAKLELHPGEGDLSAAAPPMSGAGFGAVEVPPLGPPVVPGFGHALPSPKAHEGMPTAELPLPLAGYEDLAGEGPSAEFGMAEGKHKFGIDAIASSDEEAPSPLVHLSGAKRPRSAPSTDGVTKRPRK